MHGQGDHRYDNVRIGLNARLDTLQAAILIEKLAVFDEEIERRNAAADTYAANLAGLVATPTLAPATTSVWAQYTIRVPEAIGRDRLAAGLKELGVPTAIYYPIPLSQQTAYKHFPTAPGGTPVSDRLAADVLSLPMHADLDAPTLTRVTDAVAQCVRELSGKVQASASSSA
jgi:dTDP-4-amino-4,6-dideoxygalactose transaminase